MCLSLCVCPCLCMCYSVSLRLCYGVSVCVCVLSTHTAFRVGGVRLVLLVSVFYISFLLNYILHYRSMFSLLKNFKINFLPRLLLRLILFHCFCECWLFEVVDLLLSRMLPRPVSTCFCKNGWIGVNIKKLSCKKLHIDSCAKCSTFIIE